MKALRNIAITLLLVLGLLMLIIGIMNSMLPPALTGVGFGAIAAVFIIDSK